MNVRCPHCHSLIDSIDDASFVDVCCPSCGSSFSLIGDDMTKTHQPPRARLLAQFKLVRQLGIGKFGAVWLAQDTQLDRTVAIKIPRKEALDAEEAEAFFRDARAAAGLKHPNIVSVHEVGRQEDTVYIVTDYIDGANLREWLTGQRLSFRESAELLIKVAEAVHHAHQGGVVHRDLKPGNIMLDRDGEPHVIDFGLARRESGDMTVTFDGHILGTPAYMSPEQAKGRAHEADRRSDVYSLGVILFELLSGELPFRGEAQMLLLQIERDEPPRPRRLNSRVPRDLETITLKCLQKEPGRRYQTAQDLADDLRHWMRREPIVARPVGQIERGWRWARRNPLVAGLSAALVLILLGGIVVSNRFAIEANARAKDALAEKARADSEREKAEDARKLEAEQALRAQLAEAQATQDARRASLEAQKAQEVASFLAKMFEDFAPFKLVGLRFGSTQKTEAAANMTAREILDRGAERITAELADQPAVQAALKDTIGNVYLGLGMLDKATVMIEEAYELRAKHVPRESLDMAASLYSLAALRFAQMRFVHSAQAFEEALAIRRKLLGDDHELVDATRESLASLLGIFRPRDSDRDIHEARQLFRESLEWRRKHLGNKHRDTAMAMFGLAATLLSFSTDDAEGLGGAVQLMVTRGPEAASLLAEATPILLSDPDTKALGVAVTQAQIAELRIIMGRPEAAVPYTRKALAALREVVDDNHPAMHIAKGIAVRHLAHAGQYDEAEKIYRECLTLARERNLTVPLIFVTFLRSFAEPLLEQDQPRAVALYRDTYEITKYVLLRDRQSQVDMAPDPGAYAFIAWNYANVLEECDKYVEAEATCREGLELVPRDYRGGFETLRLTLYLGDALHAQGRFAEAEKICRRGLELAESCQFPPRVEGDFWKSRGLYELARALQSQGKLEDSAKYCQNVKALGDETWAPRAEELLAEINGKPSSD